MSQRLTIRRFMSRSFEVVVRQGGASGTMARLVREAAAEEPPVDALGLLAGDGMWVGGGGATLLRGTRIDGRDD
jgi:hypothetical protein